MYWLIYFPVAKMIVYVTFFIVEAYFALYCIPWQIDYSLNFTCGLALFVNNAHRKIAILTYFSRRFLFFPMINSGYQELAMLSMVTIKARL